MGEILYGRRRSKQAGPFEYNKGASLRRRSCVPTSPLDPVFSSAFQFVRAHDIASCTYHSVMSIIVQKYGGSSVADVGKLRYVAERVMQTARRGHQVVVVVSAMGDT